MGTLYEELGGAEAIEQAVMTFYRRVLADERVARFFDDVDMDRQVAKQRAFLTMVMGGPNAYTGRDMGHAHRHLLQKGLADEHVDIVIEHLGATLASLGATEVQIAQVAGIANSVRGHILGRAHQPAAE